MESLWSAISMGWSIVKTEMKTNTVISRRNRGPRQTIRNGAISGPQIHRQLLLGFSLRSMTSLEILLPHAPLETDGQNWMMRSQ